MKTVFRWFGSNDDSVTLHQIRQIPGVSGIAGALQDISVGETWPVARIKQLKDEVNRSGLELEVIESVNIHDDIKLGVDSRDRYIENYRQTIRHLGQAGVKVICYNFMPVFDWLRSDLAKPLIDQSTVLAYDERLVPEDPMQLMAEVEQGSKGYSIPGWEPERLKEIKTLFQKYEGLDASQLLDNLKYFLEGVIPVCEECDVRMAIHPDDPPWPVFGLPRIVNSKAHLAAIVELVDSPYNGLTLCTGSLGANPANDVPELIRYFGAMGRIHFAHVRNIKIEAKGKFHETSHLSSDGSLDMFAIMKAYRDIDFQGYLRPDHGRMIWGENARPGYGLYDRALGVMYLHGLWEALEKMG